MQEGGSERTRTTLAVPCNLPLTEVREMYNPHIETGRVLKPKSTELIVNTRFNQLGPSAPLAAVLGITGGS